MKFKTEIHVLVQIEAADEEQARSIVACLADDAGFRTEIEHPSVVCLDTDWDILEAHRCRL